MKLTPKAEKELQAAINSTKVQVAAVDVLDRLKDWKFTNAEMLALSLVLTQTTRKVLEGGK
jgi:hypothetical protein